MLALMFAILSTQVHAFSHREKDYFVEPIADDQMKVTRLLDEIKKRNPKIWYGTAATIVQHIEGDLYLISLGGEKPIEAAHFPDAKERLVDGSMNLGYLFSGNETYSYTSTIGAKKTVRLGTFRSQNYPFENVDQLKETLIAGYWFNVQNMLEQCKECSGSGRIRGVNTQKSGKRSEKKTGEDKCQKCEGGGKILYDIIISWNSKSPRLGGDRSLMPHD